MKDKYYQLPWEPILPNADWEDEGKKSLEAIDKMLDDSVSSILVEAGRLLTMWGGGDDFFNEFFLFVSNKKLNKRGSLKINNIKRNLSKKFKKRKINEIFLEKDNLIHYY